MMLRVTAVEIANMLWSGHHEFLDVAILDNVGFVAGDFSALGGEGNAEGEFGEPGVGFKVWYALLGEF